MKKQTKKEQIILFGILFLLFIFAIVGYRIENGKVINPNNNWKLNEDFANDFCKENNMKLMFYINFESGEFDFTCINLKTDELNKYVLRNI